MNVSNSTDNAVVNGTLYDDNISNSGYRTIINAGIGNDSIYNSGAYSNVDAGIGDDSISNRGSNSLVDGGIGADVILNSGNNSSILGGIGNDYIIEDADRSTIDGGIGDDLISLSAAHSNAMIVFASSGGNDVVYGWKIGDSFSINADAYSTLASGSDVIVSIDSGSITFKNAVNSFNIENDSIVADDFVSLKNFDYNNTLISTLAAVPPATITAELRHARDDSDGRGR